MTFKKPTRAGLGAVVRSPARHSSAYLRSTPTPRRRLRRPRRRRRRGRCRAGGRDGRRCDAQSDGKLLAQFGRHRLDADLDGHRADDDRPGPGLFYGGMVRKKNVGDTVMTSFAITCLISVLWLFFTYSLAFRSGTPFIGGLDRAFLQGIVSDISKVAKNIGNPNSLAPTIPETVYSMFQLTFAIITRGADRRLVRGAHEVLGHAVVHRPVGDLRLFADRPLGLGTGRHLQLAPTTRPGSRCSTSPAARWCTSIPAPPA